MALQARSSPRASLEPGSGSAARPGWRALGAGIRADPGRADNPQPYPWCRFLLPPSSSCSQRACVPSRKGWKRGVWRGPRECPRDWQSSLGLFRPAGNMGVLRVGLCPGLTQEMIQLLRSRRIKTGDRVCACQRAARAAHSLGRPRGLAHCPGIPAGSFPSIPRGPRFWRGSGMVGVGSQALKQGGGFLLCAGHRAGSCSFVISHWPPEKAC